MKLVICFAFTLVALSAWAAVPLQVAHQGYLLDGSDQPVSGPVTLTFQLYADSIGGSALWTESHANVAVANGIYTVVLGSTNPLGDSLFDHPQLWLGTQVNSDAEMVPRLRLSSVPFALRAAKVESLSSANVSQMLQLLNSLPDADGDGHNKFSAGGDDCDDLDPAVYPGAPEICDGKDNNCNGQIDEGFQTTWYRDNDGDTFGDSGNVIKACAAPAGFVAQAGDCNDANPAIHPGATEVCDGIDNNCNGQIDEGLLVTVYADFDLDGYGDPSAPLTTCNPPEFGFVGDNTDCDDRNPAIHPGATEICNGIDDNCDGAVDNGATCPAGYICVNGVCVQFP